MDDLFDAFETIDEDIDNTLVESTAVDKMANLETLKRNEAREYSENLLQRLTTVGRKRRNDDDLLGAPSVKISVLGKLLFFFN